MTSWWRKAMLAVATAALFAVAAVLDYLDLRLAALIVLVGAIGAAGLVLALTLKRVGDVLTQSRATSRQVQRLERTTATSAGTNLELLQSVRADVTTLSGQLELATHAVKEGAAQSERMLQDVQRRLDQRSASSQGGVGANTRSIDQVQSDLIQEFEALLRLRDEYPLRFESPLLWNFALSPRSMWQVANLVRELEPSTIVELGSGLSTLYLARCAMDNPGTTIYSLEHSDEYLEATRRLLHLHDATEQVELVHAPLVDTEVGGRTFSWYRVPEGFPGTIDLLLVDGPPGASGPMARKPAVGCLLDRLPAGAVIVLDDTHRADEREIAGSWVREFGLRRRHSLTPRQMVLERPAPR